MLDGVEDFAIHTSFPEGNYPFLATHETEDEGRKRVFNGRDSQSSYSPFEIISGPKGKTKNIKRSKFSGEVVLLTSPITFSADSVFVPRCTDELDCQVFGEATGSSSGIFCGGGFLNVTLPHSGIVLHLPVMERHIALTNENTNPLHPNLPTMEVTPSLDNYRTGHDAELDAALDYLRSAQ